MNGTGKYILDGHTPVEETDLLKWAKWFENADRRVALTEYPEGRISTVFLGLDHNFGCDGRCSTWEEAEAMHAEAVEHVKREIAQRWRSGVASRCEREDSTLPVAIALGMARATSRSEALR